MPKVGLSPPVRPNENFCYIILAIVTLQPYFSRILKVGRKLTGLYNIILFIHV